MTFLMGAVLLCGCVVYVALPFLSDSEVAARKDRQITRREKAVKHKEDIIANLKDIEMDFQMGKLSDEDYSQLKSEFEGRAVDALRDLEKLESQGASKKSGA